ncbi:MAG: LamG domain-containing protein [Kiritimatiellae bacterium]|nr:LamG domain-containing protein [Kiritimatiellia bacterium]
MRQGMQAIALIAVMVRMMTSPVARGETIAWWRFEPGALTEDSSGNGYSLTNTAALSTNDVPVYDPNGSTGSVYFNGAAVMRTLSTLDLSGHTNLTIQWFMKPQTSGTAVYWEQSPNGATAGALASYLNNDVANRVEVLQRLTPFSATLAVTSAVPAGTSDGRWHHYAMTIDTAGSPTNLAAIKLYIDGVLRGGHFFRGSSDGNPVSLINDYLYLGARSSGAYYFTGYLDEMRISDEILSPDSFPRPETIAWWRFEPGALTEDSSGCGNILSNTGTTSTNDVPANDPNGGTGSAYFNGSAAMQTVSTLDLSDYTNLTIQLFMKPAVSALAIPLEHSPNLNTYRGGVAIYLNNDGKGIQSLQTLNAPGTTLIAESDPPGGTACGGWHHYAVTIDATQTYTNATAMKLYIDGIYQGGQRFYLNSSGGDPASLLSQVLYLGARGGSSYRFTGCLDEVRISNGILSPDTFPRSRTLAYWRFEPGDPTADSSGCGNRLTNSWAIVSNDVPVFVNGASAGSAYFTGSPSASKRTATLVPLCLAGYTNLTVEWFLKPQTTSTAVFWEQSPSGGTAGSLASYLNNDDVNYIEVLQRLSPNQATLAARHAVPGGTANGAWHHYAMTIDTAGSPTNLMAIHLYIDGVDQGGQLFRGTSDGSAVHPINDYLYLGARSNYSYPLTGFLDEMRISSEILAPEEFLCARPKGTMVLIR